MLINHRTSAYVDNDELERAHGLLFQALRSGELDDERDKWFYEGAASALLFMWDANIGSAEALGMMLDRRLGELKEDERKESN